MQKGDEASPSIILAGRALLVKRIITLEPHGANNGKHTLKIFFLGTTGPILMKLCMKHQRPKPFIIYANYDPGLTLTYFMAC